MNTKIKIILSLSLMILVLILVFQNVAPVGIRFFFWTLSMSGALLFIVLFISGAILGGSLFGYIQQHKKSEDNN
ncbi:LapA family protein [bacterium]|nr:LapA family protein [candidate division CSSED10-310 bacterium]